MTDKEKEVLAEASEVLDKISIQDFQDYLKPIKKKLEESAEAEPYLIHRQREFFTKENAFNASLFLSMKLNGIISYIVSNEMGQCFDLLEEAIDKKVVSWYEDSTLQDIDELMLLYSALMEIKPNEAESTILIKDRMSKNIWGIELVPNKEIYISTDNKKTKGVIISFSFPEEQMTGHKLTDFDKLVYIAVSSLCYAGNKQISVKMINKAMGNGGSPSKDQIDRINRSLTNLGFTRLNIDNREELKTKTKYQHFVVADEALLNFQRIKAVVRGQEVSVINLLTDPVLLRFARQREQITTINTNLLEDKLNNTDMNISLKIYLLDYISSAKNNKSLSRKLLFTTLCDKCGAADRQTKQRLKDKIKKLMSFYQSNHFIKSYRLDKDNNLYFDL